MVPRVSEEARLKAAKGVEKWFEAHFGFIKSGEYVPWLVSAVWHDQRPVTRSFDACRFGRRIRAYDTE